MACCDLLLVPSHCPHLTALQLEKSYAPPEFEMPTRTAVLLNTVFSSFMYASGTPLLLPVCAVALMVSYAVDKVAILRMYKRWVASTPCCAREAAARSSVPSSTVLLCSAGRRCTMAPWPA